MGVFENAVCITLGIVAVDLTFDYQDAAVATWFYHIVIPGPITKYVVTPLIGIMAGCLLLGGFDTAVRGTKCWTARVACFACAFPYLQFKLQPAELRVAAAAAGAATAEDLECIKVGHLVLAACLTTALLAGVLENGGGAKAKATDDAYAVGEPKDASLRELRKSD